MRFFMQQLVNGLSIGFVYALLALGYTMVYGVLRMVNFAHGEMFMLGAMVALVVLRGLGVVVGPFNVMAGPLTGLQLAVVLPVCLLGAAFFSGLLAMVVERSVYRPLRGAAVASVTIAALGVSTVLQNATMLIGQPNIKGFPRLLPRHSFTILEAVLDNMQLFTGLASLFALLLLFRVVNRTYLGRCIRATAEDRDAASLMGVNTNRTVALVFFIGSGLGAIGGVLYSMYYEYAYYAMGVIAGTKGFAAAVLGGIGNITGAALGGLLLGIIETIGAGYLPVISGGALGAEWKHVFAFIILVMVLLFRRQGLLGEVTEKTGA